MFVLPFALWLAGQLRWFAWKMNFVVLELLGLAAGVALLSAVYALEPFAHKRRKRKPQAK